jgi:hypothetical protein
MGTENLKNRSTAWTPALIAQVTADITAAVKDIGVQFLDALRRHPEAMMSARAKFRK